jgi:hypothetical protein
MTRFILSFWRFRVSWYGAPSLMRARVCNLLVQLILGLVRAATLGSKSRRTHGYYRRSVSLYVLVSSLLWDLWPDVIFCLKVAVLSLWGALSDEKSGLSPVSHCQQCLVHCQKCNIIYIVHVTCFMYMQYILDLCQHRFSTADHAKTSVPYATTAI